MGQNASVLRHRRNAYAASTRQRGLKGTVNKIKLRVKRRGFRAFITEHRSMMVLSGSLLVFTTFLVNEAIRDNLRDYLDSLRQAQSTFVLEQDHVAILTEMEAANRRQFGAAQVLPIAEGESAKRQVELQTMNFQNEATFFEELGREGLRVGRSLLGLGHLLENAPMGNYTDRTRVAASIQALLQKQEDLQSGIQDASALLQRQGASLQKGDVSTAIYLSNEIRSRFTTIASRTDDYSNAMYQFSRIQYNEVSDATEKLDALYNSVKLLSYFLYALGWSLALMGKLYGVEIAVD